MKRFAIPAITIGALATAAVGLAGAAGAVPTGPSATQVVGQLQAQGFHVVLNKVGAAALDQCTVSSVRPGPTFTRMDSGAPGAMDDIVTTVTSKTVYVDVAC